MEDTLGDNRNSEKYITSNATIGSEDKAHVQRSSLVGEFHSKRGILTCKQEAVPYILTITKHGEKDSKYK